jgi:hypothetical protein
MRTEPPVPSPSGAASGGGCGAIDRVKLMVMMINDSEKEVFI